MRLRKRPKPGPLPPSELAPPADLAPAELHPLPPRRYPGQRTVDHSPAVGPAGRGTPAAVPLERLERAHRIPVDFVPHHVTGPPAQVRGR